MSIQKTYSFEFFPPQTEVGKTRLKETREAFVKLAPSFFSVTYGAGGSTQDRTIETVLEIKKESGIQTAPHLSCVGSSRRRIRDILNFYQKNEIQRIVALRGDFAAGLREIGVFNYASDLVEFIRKESNDYFTLEVAAYPEMHPEAQSFEKDLQHFVNKVNAGADSAITQYFYNADAYFHFVERCQQLGVDIPIVPGIMPICNFAQLARFSDACGAEIPRWLRKQLEGYIGDDDAIYQLGLEVVSDLCRRLLEAGAPGLHFYSMNRIQPTLAIWNNLGLSEDDRCSPQSS